MGTSPSCTAVGEINLQSKLLTNLFRLSAYVKSKSRRDNVARIRTILKSSMHFCVASVTITWREYLLRSNRFQQNAVVSVSIARTLVHVRMSLVVAISSKVPVQPFRFLISSRFFVLHVNHNHKTEYDNKQTAQTN